MTLSRVSRGFQLQGYPDYSGHPAHLGARPTHPQLARYQGAGQPREPMPHGTWPPRPPYYATPPLHSDYPAYPRYLPHHHGPPLGQPHPRPPYEGGPHPPPHIGQTRHQAPYIRPVAPEKEKGLGQHHARQGEGQEVRCRGLEEGDRHILEERGRRPRDRSPRQSTVEGGNVRSPRHVSDGEGSSRSPRHSDGADGLSPRGPTSQPGSSRGTPRRHNRHSKTVSLVQEGEAGSPRHRKSGHSRTRSESGGVKEGHHGRRHRVRRQSPVEERLSVHESDSMSDAFDDDGLFQIDENFAKFLDDKTSCQK